MYRHATSKHIVEPKWVTTKQNIATQQCYKLDTCVVFNFEGSLQCLKTLLTTLTKFVNIQHKLYVSLTVWWYLSN